MYFHAIKKTKTYIVETRKYSYTLPLSPNLKQMATESGRSGQVPSKLELECRVAAQPARLSNEVLLPMAPLVMGQRMPEGHSYWPGGASRSQT